MKRRSCLWFLLFLGGSFVAFSWCLGGFFSETDVCTHCGDFRGVSRWLWIPSSTIRPTLLSSYQQSLPGGAAQEHHWILVQGGGDSITCALGAGSYLTRAVESDRAVSALKCIREHFGEEVAQQWTDRLLDPQTSMNACCSIERLYEAAGSFNVAYAKAIEEFEWYKTRPIDEPHMPPFLRRH